MKLQEIFSSAFLTAYSEALEKLSTKTTGGVKRLELAKEIGLLDGMAADGTLFAQILRFNSPAEAILNKDLSDDFQKGKVPPNYPFPTEDELKTNYPWIGLGTNCEYPAALYKWYKEFLYTLNLIYDLMGFPIASGLISGYEIRRGVNGGITKISSDGDQVTSTPAAKAAKKNKDSKGAKKDEWKDSDSPESDFLEKIRVVMEKQFPPNQHRFLAAKEILHLAGYTNKLSQYAPILSKAIRTGAIDGFESLQNKGITRSDNPALNGKKNRKPQVSRAEKLEEDAKLREDFASIFDQPSAVQEETKNEADSAATQNSPTEQIPSVQEPETQKFSETPMLDAMLDEIDWGSSEDESSEEEDDGEEIFLSEDEDSEG